MIIVERIEVSGLSWATTRCKNPSKSEFDSIPSEPSLEDLTRAIKLGQAEKGSGHDCYLKGITVNIDMWMPRWMHIHMLRYRFIDWVSCMSVQKNMKQLLYSKTAMMDIDPEHVQWLRLQYESDKGREWMVRHIPEGLLLGCSFRTNYMQLKTIVSQRAHHKMDEWREFCHEIMMQCPYFCELTGAHYMLDGEKIDG